MNQKLNRVILPITVALFVFYLCWQLYFMDKVYFFCPVDYKQGTIVIRSDSYGDGEFQARRNGSRRHNGIDLEADVGAPVYAVRSGRVLNAQGHKGLGNYVEILHEGGIITIYGHLLNISVSKNQIVRQGDKIAEIGKTGNANYSGVIAHLHFEIRAPNGRPLDPAGFLQ